MKVKVEATKVTCDCCGRAVIAGIGDPLPAGWLIVPLVPDGAWWHFCSRDCLLGFLEALNVQEFGSDEAARLVAGFASA